MPTLCPACDHVMPSDKMRRALSRYRNAYICPDCGTREAFEGAFWLDRMFVLQYKQTLHRAHADGGKQIRWIDVDQFKTRGEAKDAAQELFPCGATTRIIETVKEEQKHV